jgi:hypothetical protein
VSPVAVLMDDFCHSFGYAFNLKFKAGLELSICITSISTAKKSIFSLVLLFNQSMAARCSSLTSSANQITTPA